MSNLDDLNKILAEQMQRAEAFYDKKTLKGMVKNAIEKVTKAYTRDRKAELRPAEWKQKRRSF